MRRHPLRHARRAYLLPALLLASLAAACVAGSARPLGRRRRRDRARRCLLVRRRLRHVARRQLRLRQQRHALRPDLDDRRQERQRAVVRRRQRLGHDRRLGVARPLQRHDPRSLGEADRAADWRTVAFKERTGGSRVRPLLQHRHRPSVGSRCGPLRAHETRGPAALAVRGLVAPRGDLRRLDAAAVRERRPGFEQAGHRRAGQLAPARFTSAGTPSGPSGSPARSTTSVSTTGLSRSPSSRAT